MEAMSGKEDPPLARDGRERPDPVRNIVIVGGGTAGWIAASVLARAFHGHDKTITVAESADIGIIGVGEATIPPFVDLLRFLGVDEKDFIHHTGATYKLGIKFQDWRRTGESYWHPFGTFGEAINRRPFFHAWQKAKADGLKPRFNDFSACAALGDQNRFRFPDPAGSAPAAGLRYALHFNATLVAKYLRAYAERLGVRRLERTVTGATQRDDGFLQAIVFSDGARLEGDLFIDCSGFRGLLIEDVLKTGYIDWSDLLPCDRAVAAPSELRGARPPYTLSAAMSAGWRWRIPLQHRVGNGYVYSSRHISDQEATDELLQSVGDPLAEPRLLRFTTGRRKAFWSRNCVALGLASGFLEPLESTSIHLAVSGVYNLLDHFPTTRFDQANIDAYNDALIDEYERLRDFIVLHYCLTERDDTPFWSDRRAAALPASLQGRIDLYKRTGRVKAKPGELFTDLSWFYIFEGMGVVPESHDPLMDVVSTDRFSQILATMAEFTAAAVRGAPSHDSQFSPIAPAVPATFARV